MLRKIVGIVNSKPIVMSDNKTNPVVIQWQAMIAEASVLEDIFKDILLVRSSSSDKGIYDIEKVLKALFPKANISISAPLEDLQEVSTAYNLCLAGMATSSETVPYQQRIEILEQIAPNLFTMTYFLGSRGPLYDKLQELVNQKIVASHLIISMTMINRDSNANICEDKVALAIAEAIMGGIRPHLVTGD